MDKSRESADGVASILDTGDKPLPGSDAPTGVRRVNNMPLMIIGGVVVIFVILVAMVAAQRGKPKDVVEVVAPLSESNQALDHMLANAAVSGIIEDPDDVPSFAVARPGRLDDPPLPDGVSRGEPHASSADDPRSAERMKLFQTAMTARTGVSRAAPVAPAGSATSRDESKQEPAVTGNDRDERVPVHAEGDYAQFGKKHKANEGDDRWSLNMELQNPRTRYEVRAGSVIPATMISGINSELPGQIVAQVSQDVFDTPTGKHRLVPQGSRLIGRYTNRIVYGQSRVLVAWQRIVFPDGKALDIGSMEGVDAAGYAGFNDQVDRHYIRLFGSAILMSGITSGLTSSRVTPNNDPFGSSNAAQFNENLANSLGQVATKMIEKNMNVAPTLKIRPGYRFNVMAVKDLAFEHPYRAFDY
ncbi:conjugal transfer protein TrbI [Luteibacter aegosomaticola]|uniref:TrbI/VirB10 family protein n=1 Tax=Luteibacter aegosomaticola TaxID=2911538 RepID=UPI001FF87C4F|nr:TrbI/VirB10 family protein [Luteibacter aegosomaticola]UPG90355.1 conjugal transfer protein TrbI [Luteibacter aegosomaticola]